MRHQTGIRRVIVVVLDGLRPDAIDRFDMANVRELMAAGAAASDATTVSPSVTTAAITSLLTGVSPARHRIVGDRPFIPRGAADLAPLPAELSRSGFPSSAFLARLPTVFRGIGARIGRRFGFGDTRFSGETAAEILLAARTTLRAQRRGLVLFHWPDADNAGHEQGWMSPAYADGCRRLDAALGELMAMIELHGDPGTMLVALADHGGGGGAANDHDGDHPLNRTIPMLFAGPSVVPSTLDGVSLLDVPPTVLFALGLDVPPVYEGRVLTELFTAAPQAVAV